MATMNISLPDSMKSYVRDRVEKSDFSNPSDYLRSLIRADKAQTELEQMLLDGLNSGKPEPLMDKDRGRYSRIINRSKK